MRLFVDRARAIEPGFELNRANARSIAGICRQLDGIPLAIELASARIDVLAPEQIAARLDDRFSLLSRGVGVSESHHRTLRAALDWSYAFLSAPEQALLQRLSLFPAGCTLPVARAICVDETGEQPLLDLLSSLVGKSLVVANTVTVREARYRLPETIRQYARGKLREADAESAACDRLLAQCLRLAEETRPQLEGPHQRSWLDWLEDEYDNIRAALSWSVESSQPEAGLRIAIAIYLFWTIRDYAEEGLAWMERLLGVVENVSAPIAPVLRANALAYAAFLAGFRGKIAAQIAYGREATAVAEAAGDQGKPALAWALAAQSFGARAAGDFQSEFELGKRVIQLHRDLGNRNQLGLVLTVTSFSAMALGEYASARAMLDEALPILRDAGNPYRIAMALNYSGDLARCEKRYRPAQRAYEESLRLLRDLDAPRDLASVLHNLGYCYLHTANPERAGALFSESLAIQVAQGNIRGVAECLSSYAAWSSVRGLHGAAARLLAAAAAVGGQDMASAWAATRMEHDHWLAVVRSKLTPEDFDAEQRVGYELNLDEAVAYARGLPLSPAPAPSATRTGGLTPRELEVAALIAAGRTNGEIGRDLSVSKRTVETHMAHILAKLGLTHRSQVVRWALETGLVRSGQ